MHRPQKPVLNQFFCIFIRRSGLLVNFVAIPSRENRCASVRVWCVSVSERKYMGNWSSALFHHFFFFFASIIIMAFRLTAVCWSMCGGKLALNWRDFPCDRICRTSKTTFISTSTWFPPIAVLIVKWKSCACIRDKSSREREKRIATKKSAHEQVSCHTGSISVCLQYHRQ